MITRFLMRFITTLTLVLLLGTAGVVILFYHFGRGLPSYEHLAKYEPPMVTRLYAGDGTIFAEFAKEKRVFVPIDAVPRRVIDAFLAAEDKNFYEHPGIDVTSIISAAIANIGRLGLAKRPIGASTITQQVAKNFLLSDISNQVSLERKVKEAILAFRLEQAYSKDHILELYLNEIYLGAGAYGVAAAAQVYFDKSLKDLSIAEAAFLAGLPKAPSRYHPAKAPDLAMARRDYVIGRLLEDEKISQEEAATALEEPLRMALSQESDAVNASYFAEEVRRELIAKYGEDSIYKGGMVVRTSLDPKMQRAAREALKEGLSAYDRRHGWRGPLGHVTLDPSAGRYEKVPSPANPQAPWLSIARSLAVPPGLGYWKPALVLSVTAQHAVLGFFDGATGILPLEDMRWARRRTPAGHMGPEVRKVADVLAIGDLIAVDASKGKDGKIKEGEYALRQIPEASGAILAMDPHTGRVLAVQGGFSFKISQFNRATQAMRQTGSAFKAFAFLAALERGIAPNTILSDSPFEIDMGYGLGIWRPKNSDNKFLGEITLRRAMELSRNLATIRLVHEKVGMKYVASLAERFGIVDRMPVQLAMVLGAAETTVIRMAAALSTIANGGYKVTPRFVDRIQDRHGKTVMVGEKAQCLGCEQGAEAEPIPAIYEKRERLTDAVSAAQMASLMQGSVARGTARLLQDLGVPIAAKTGTSNEFRDAWIVAFTPDLVVVVYVGHDTPKSLGEGEFGAKAAGPIAHRFLKEVLKGVDPVPFRIPAGVKMVRLNAMTGEPTSSSDPQAIWEIFRAQEEAEASYDGTDEGQPVDSDRLQQGGDQPLNDQVPGAQDGLPALPPEEDASSASPIKPGMIY
ncbi:MAG: penicillin-binding protein 1A [Holosporales bacterium]